MNTNLFKFFMEKLEKSVELFTAFHNTIKFTNIGQPLLLLFPFSFERRNAFGGF